MESSAEKSNAGRPAASGTNAALIVGLIVVVLIALGLGAYIYMKGGGLQKPTPIGDVLGNLREWDEQQVVVEGTVSAPLNVMSMKMYRLTDDSGSIMVVTERGLPTSGAEVRVEGFVKQVFKVAGMEQTIVYEGSGDPEK